MPRQDYPIRYRTVRLLGGQREDINVLALPPFFSPSGSQNMRMRDNGALRMMDGYTTLNSTAITTNIGASAVRVVGLYHYRSHSGGSVTRREVAVVDDGTNEYEIWHSTDGGSTWTFLKDLGSGAVGLIPSFAQYENELYIGFGGSIAVQMYNGTTVAAAGETQPTAPTIAEGSAGVLNGIYSYKTAEIDGSGNVGPASVATSKILLINKQCDLSSIDTGAGGARIFRTLGDGDRYFRVADVSGTTYSDNIPDKDLLDNPAEVEYTGDAPTSGSRGCVNHRSRVYYIGTDTYPNRIWYSDVGYPDSVGVDSFERIHEGEDGDELILGVSFEGELVLFKEHSVSRLSGDGPNSFNLIKTQCEKGTIGKHSAVVLPSGAVFTNASGGVTSSGGSVIAYMTDTDLRITEGVTDRIVSWAAHRTFESLSYQYRNQAWVEYYDPYKWLVCAIPTGQNTYSYLGWDISNGSWFPVQMWPHMRCACIAETATAGNVFLAGQANPSTGGSIYQLFTGTDADGSNITAIARLNADDWDLHHQSKMLRSLDPEVAALGSSVTLTMNIYRGRVNGSPTAFCTETVDMAGSNLDSINPGPVETKDSNGAYPIDEAFTYEFQVTGQTIWELRGFTAGAQVLPPSIYRRS